MEEKKFYKVEQVNIECDGSVVETSTENEVFQTLVEAKERAMQIWNFLCYNDKKQRDILVNEIVDDEIVGLTSAREIEIAEIEKEKENVIKEFIEEVGAKEIEINELNKAAQRIFETRDNINEVSFGEVIEDGYIYYTKDADEIQVELELIDCENKIVKLKSVYYI